VRFYRIYGTIGTISDTNQKDVSKDFPITALIEQIHQQLTGASLTDQEPIFIERYSYGAMSSGDVSPKFWAEQAIPLLLTRYRESK
jgi:hypothetical protein